MVAVRRKKTTAAMRQKGTIATSPKEIDEIVRREYGAIYEGNVPAAVDQQARLPRRQHGRAQVDAAHGPARPFAHAVLHRDHAGRAVVAFAQAPRDDADDGLCGDAYRFGDADDGEEDADDDADDDNDDDDAYSVA